jgi:hypothetical protein
VAERAEPVLTKLMSTERRIEWGAAALVFAIFLQTGGIIWWGATMSQRMTTVEAKISATASTGETIARLDERTASMLTTIDRLDRRFTEAEVRKAERRDEQR